VTSESIRSIGVQTGTDIEADPSENLEIEVIATAHYMSVGAHSIEH